MSLQILLFDSDTDSDLPFFSSSLAKHFYNISISWIVLYI